MDLDGDGRLDVITGSWPGELYVFRGAEEGGYAAATKLQDEDGKALNYGKASVVFASDWDRDGDLDLVVGCIEGHVWFAENKSGGKALTFEPAVRLAADGKDIVVKQGDSGPAIADWDGDGTLDLILGAGDGSVTWYPNAARAGAPNLGAARTLVESNKGSYTDSSSCGRRTKPHVVDWDGDGRLDLLVGDFSMTKPVPKVLTDEQELKKVGLEAELKALNRVSRPRTQALMRTVLEELGMEVPEEGGLGAVFQGMSDEQRKAYSERYVAAMSEDEMLRKINGRRSEVYRELTPLRGRPQVHGRVWFFKRKPMALSERSESKGPGEEMEQAPGG